MPANDVDTVGDSEVVGGCPIKAIQPLPPKHQDKPATPPILVICFLRLALFTTTIEEVILFLPIVYYTLRGQLVNATRHSTCIFSAVDTYLVSIVIKCFFGALNRYSDTTSIGRNIVKVGIFRIRFIAAGAIDTREGETIYC